MPNILLTNSCNRRCPYCFALAQVQLGVCRAAWEMSEAELDTVLGYLDFRHDVVSLLGGEPTLHSRFAEIVSEVAARRFPIKVFTNGTTPHLRSIPASACDDELRLILNLNRPESYGRSAWGEIEENARHFGRRMSLSFNVYEPAFFWDHLRDLILRRNLMRRIRIGLAQPVHGMGNSCLPEEAIPDACARLVEMAVDLASDGIMLGLDCGFRGCAFTERQRGILLECGAELLFDCKPVLDIGPDLMVWRCFPFSATAGVRLLDFRSLREVAEHFDQVWAHAMTLGNTPNCRDCPHFGRVCRGGCLSRTVNQRQPPALS
ncbi:MAG: radical SAM protein [Verrucomicrobiia bacterium]|jgi:radical SAM protein with 4Fe4S-binding SPASM domain